MGRKILFLLLIALVTASFAVPEIFNYQGKLTDASGVGINDTVDMTINIYDGPDAGTATLLSTDALVDVPVVKGLFDIQYDVDLDQTELMGDLYMELVVEGSAFDPLVQLATVPFALSAQYVDSAYYAVKADSLGNYVATDLLPNTLDGAYDQGGPGAGYLITADSGPVDIRTAYTGPSDGEALEIRTNDDAEEALYVYNAGAGPAIFCSGDLRINGEIWSNDDIKVHLDKNESVSDEMFYVVNDTGVTVFSVDEHGDAMILGELDPASVTFQPQTVVPTGAEGKVYYDDSEGKLKWHDGASWQDFGSGTGPTGDFIWDQDTAAQNADFWIENEGEFGVYMSATEIDLLYEEFEGTWPVVGWTILGVAWDRNDNWGRTNYAGGDGYCADADADAYGGACDGHLQTPSIDISTLSNATLEFIASYNYIGGDSANVNISTDGGATWIPLLHWEEDHSAYGPGELVSISLDPYIGYSVIIDFYYYADSWDWYFMVDNVRVFTTEYSTPAPKIIADGPNGNIELIDPAGDVIFDGTGLTTTGGAGIVGYDNATSGLAATNVQEAIDELSGASFDTLWAGDLGDVSDTIYAMDNFFVNGELIADSIQAVADMIFLDDNITVDGCGTFGGGVAPTTTIYSESFDGGSTPTGWAETGATGSAALSYATTSSHPTGITPSDGTHMVIFNSWTASWDDQIQLEQTTSFSTVGYSNIMVNLDVYHDVTYTNLDSVVLHYSTDGAIWTPVTTWLRYDGSTGWATESVTLPAAADNQATVYLALLFVSQYGNDIHVDNLVVSAPTGAPPPAVDICDGNITADGDIEGSSFTLDGVTITEWPTGGGVENDTIWSESGNPDDTIVVMSQLKVYGELIADSIQAVGPVIEMDDHVDVHGDLNADATVRAVDVIASNDVNANTSMTLNGVTITAWPGGGATGSLDAAYDYLAPGGGRIIQADAGPVIIDGMGVPDTVLTVLGYNPAGPAMFVGNLGGPTAIEGIGDLWMHGAIISDILVSTPVITNFMGDTVFVESNLWAQEFVADTIEARNEYTYFKDAIWIEDSIWMDGAWHTTWGGGGAGQWEDAGIYKRVIGNDNIRAYEADDVYGLYAVNGYNDGDHSAVFGYGRQTDDYDYNIIGVWGTADGPSSDYYGEAIGVLGSADQTTSWYSVGVYGRLTDDATSQPGYLTGPWANSAILGDGNSLGYSGYFTGGELYVDTSATFNYNIFVEETLQFSYNSYIYYGDGPLGYALYYSPDPSASGEQHNFLIGGNLAAQIFSGGIIVDTAQVTDIYADGDTVFVHDKLWAEEFVADTIEARNEYTYFKDAIWIEDSIWMDGAWRTSWGGGVVDFDTIQGTHRDTLVVMNDFKILGELIADSIQAAGDVIELDDSIQVWGAAGVNGNIRDYGTYYGYPLPLEEGISLVQDHLGLIPPANYSLGYADYRDDQLRGWGVHHLLGGFGSYDPISIQYAATYGGVEGMAGPSAMGGLGVSGPAINAAVSGVSMDPLYYAGFFVGDVMMDGKVTVTDSLIVLGDAHIAGVLDPTGVGFEPVASNPLPTGVPGIFVDSADDDLYYYDGISTINVSSGGGGGSLQAAYDGGNSITTSGGNAVSITASSGDALYVNHTSGGNGIYNDANYWSPTGNISIGTGNFHTSSGIYQSNEDFVAKIDADNDADNMFHVRNSGDVNVFSIEEDGDVYIISGIYDGSSFGTAGQVLTTDGSDVSWVDLPASSVDFDTINATRHDTVVVSEALKVMGELVADSIQAVGDIIEMDDSVDVIGGVSLLDDSTYRTDWEPLYVITVGQDNADFMTIEDAMNAITVNAWTNVLVDVAPGSYTPTRDIIVPTGVHLRGSGMDVTTIILANVAVEGEISRIHVTGDGIVTSIFGRADECWFECGVDAGSAASMTGSEILGCRIQSSISPMNLVDRGRLLDCYLEITTNATGLWDIDDNNIITPITIISGDFHVCGNQFTYNGSINLQNGKLYCESNVFKLLEGVAIMIQSGQAEIKANHFDEIGQQAIYIIGGEVNILSNDFNACGISNPPAVIDASSLGEMFAVNIIGNHIDGKGLIAGTTGGIILSSPEEGCLASVKDNIIERYYTGVTCQDMNSIPTDPLMPIDNNIIYKNVSNGLDLSIGRYLVVNNQIYNNAQGGSGVDLSETGATQLTASNNVLDLYSSTFTPVPGAFNTNSAGTMWGGGQPGQLP